MQLLVVLDHVRLKLQKPFMFEWIEWAFLFLIASTLLFFLLSNVTGSRFKHGCKTCGSLL